MWRVIEARSASILVAHMPPVAAARYRLWLHVVRAWGPGALGSLERFGDVKILRKSEALRSSRLTAQWRVVYLVAAGVVRVVVVREEPRRSETSMGER